VTAFTCAKVGKLDSLFAANASGELTSAATGFVFATMAVVLNSLASIMGELAFRISEDVPYYTTVVHIKVGEILMALYLMSLKPQAPVPLRSLLRDPASILAGFDAGTWLVVVLLVLDSWMSGLLVKRMSSVVKSVAKCMSLVVTYVLAVFALQTEPIVLIQLILALLVVNGIAAFSYISSAETKQAKGPPSSGSVAA